jgi:2-polyprenyl-6-methoxyphenol hydroxylase-like FAD-dependent oxidoreductase
MLSVFLLGDAINSHRPIAGQRVVAGAQIVHVVDVVVQAGEYQLWMAACLFTYPSQICAHGSFAP